ncbi:MAG: tyrosine-type recombinase/integrase [Anaerolineaceae bacterium]|nr:tyrosine-type recombinase/integrase [Anaerolineaceae bacterium]
MDIRPSVTDLTITDVINKYIDAVHLSRSHNTTRTYRNGLKLFDAVLRNNKIDPDKTKILSLNEDAVSWMATELKDYSPASEQCYLTSVVGFYEYLAGENLANINLPRVRLLIKQRSRRPGIRLPQFPKEEIEKLLEFAQTLFTVPTSGIVERLINYRDRAFLLTLADTGLRVHEACELRRGDIDWREGRAAVVGKGNRQAIVRFSTRSLKSIKDYINLRSEFDGASGKSLQSLPIFSRHDKAAGKKIKSLSTTTGRQIVSVRVKQCLGEEAVGTITPHSFRHYFVTTVLIASGNLKLAQELARHKNIAVTQRYTHLSNDELDRDYYDIFG